MCLRYVFFAKIVGVLATAFVARESEICTFVVRLLCEVCRRCGGYIHDLHLNRPSLSLDGMSAVRW